MGKIHCECGEYIRRGTTPLQIFFFPAGTDIYSFSEMDISYMQAGEIILRKTESDLSISGNAAFFKLSQEETLRFEAGLTVFIQVRAYDGDLAASGIAKLRVKPCITGEKMGGE